MTTISELETFCSCSIERGIATINTPIIVRVGDVEYELDQFKVEDVRAPNKLKRSFVRKIVLIANKNGIPKA